MVEVERLELSRDYSQRILSPLRIPIPPYSYMVALAGLGPARFSASVSKTDMSTNSITRPYNYITPPLTQLWAIWLFVPLAPSPTFENYLECGVIQKRFIITPYLYPRWLLCLTSNGEDREIRTLDSKIKSFVLYQLSYILMASCTRFELASPFGPTVFKTAPSPPGHTT